MAPSKTIRCSSCYIRNVKREMEQVGRLWFCKECAKAKRNGKDTYGNE